MGMAKRQGTREEVKEVIEGQIMHVFQVTAGLWQLLWVVGKPSVGLSRELTWSKLALPRWGPGSVLGCKQWVTGS